MERGERVKQCATNLTRDKCSDMGNIVGDEAENHIMNALDRCILKTDINVLNTHFSFFKAYKSIDYAHNSMSGVAPTRVKNKCTLKKIKYRQDVAVLVTI